MSRSRVWYFALRYVRGYNFESTGDPLTDNEAQRDHASGTSGPQGDALLARRPFLKWISGLGATMMAAMVGLPVVRAFISPALATVQKDSWVKVADDVALIDTDIPVRVNFVEDRVDAWLEGRQLNGVWLYTENGKDFKAYNARCTHLGCAYVYDKESKNFACPCHKGQFDVKTGKVLAGPPPRPLDELKVDVRDGSVFVDYKDFRLGIADRIET
jgi:menaquinol-cytochrome c reductase iron-sulfur subunit